MSALNYTTRWPRGNARTAANKAIRRGLPGGDHILDASKLLTDAVRSSGGRAQTFFHNSTPFAVDSSKQ